MILDLEIYDAFRRGDNSVNAIFKVKGTIFRSRQSCHILQGNTTG